MLLISVVMDDKVIRRRAPQGFMYQIDSIKLSNGIALAGFAFVSPYEYEDEIDDIFANVARDFLVTMDMNLTGNIEFTNIDTKTKYLSFGKDIANSCKVGISVYGKLVKGTRTELIMEFLRKGR